MTPLTILYGAPGEEPRVRRLLGPDNANILAWEGEGYDTRTVLINPAHILAWGTEAVKARLAEIAARRWNVEPQEDGSLLVCRGDHDKSEGCSYERYVPEQIAAQPAPAFTAEEIARAIHEGLGKGWADSNHLGNEWTNCRDMLDSAAERVLALIAPKNHRPAETGELCVDEGCPHHGTAHVCVASSGQSDRAAAGGNAASGVALTADDIGLDTIIRCIGRWVAWSEEQGAQPDANLCFPTWPSVRMMQNWLVLLRRIASHRLAPIPQQAGDAARVGELERENADLKERNTELVVGLQDFADAGLPPSYLDDSYSLLHAVESGKWRLTGVPVGAFRRARALLAKHTEPGR